MLGRQREENEGGGSWLRGGGEKEEGAKYRISEKKPHRTVSNPALTDRKIVKEEKEEKEKEKRGIPIVKKRREAKRKERGSVVFSNGPPADYEIQEEALPSSLFYELFCELSYQENQERRRLREKLDKLRELREMQIQLEKEISSHTRTASSLHSHLQTYEAHRQATVGKTIKKEESEGWPDDQLSLSLLSLLLSIQKTLYLGMEGGGGEEGGEGEEGEEVEGFKRWCGEVSQIVVRLHHNLYGLCRAAPHFDLQTSTSEKVIKVNGYRSVLKVISAYLLKLKTKVEKRVHKRAKYSFRQGEKQQGIIIIMKLFVELTNHCLKVANQTCPTEIFPLRGCDDILDDILRTNCDVFYGKLFGLHFSTRMRYIFMGLLVAMSSFGRSFNKESPEIVNKVKALMTSPASLLSTHSGQVSAYFKAPDIQFLRSFWNLQETCAVVEVDTAIRTKSPDINIVFKIPASPLMFKKRVDGKCIVEGEKWGGMMKVGKGADTERDRFTHDMVNIGPGLPLRTTKPGTIMDETIQHVQVRLLSYHEVTGQLTSAKDILNSNNRKKKPKMETAGDSRSEPKDALILHFHGGGFVAQTSKAHLNYLRDYVSSLEHAVLLTVDYSLSPDAPFPRALHECFYVYCWALKNADLLGWTGKKIVLNGDSAGANLTISVTMLAITNKVRIPDFLFPIYPALLAFPVPSPSRLLSIMDPLMGVGVLMKCLESYQGKEDGSDPFLSPSLCPTHILNLFPPTFVQIGEFDPVLDDGLDFVHKMRRIRTCDAKLSILSYTPYVYPPDSVTPLEGEGESMMIVLKKKQRQYGAMHVPKSNNTLPAIFPIENWSFGEKVTISLFSSRSPPPRPSPPPSPIRPSPSPPLYIPKSTSPLSFQPRKVVGRDVGEDEYRGGTGSAIEVVKRSGSAVRTRRRSDGGLRLLTNGSRVGREESFKGAEVKDGQQEVWEEKDRGKGSGWMGSVDVSLPNTNGETQTNLLVSREVGNIEVKLVSFPARNRKRKLLVQIRTLSLFPSLFPLSSKREIWVDVGGCGSTPCKLIEEWTREKSYGEASDVCVILNQLPVNIHAIRMMVKTSDGKLIGEAIVPLPLVRGRARRDPGGEGVEGGDGGSGEVVVKTEYENFSVGRKVGWLGLGVEVDGETIRQEKEVYFDLIKDVTHGYLGFNRVDTDCTKGTQAAIRALRFGCGLTDTPPVPGLHGENKETTRQLLRDSLDQGKHLERSPLLKCRKEPVSVNLMNIPQKMCIYVGKSNNLLHFGDYVKIVGQSPGPNGETYQVKKQKEIISHIPSSFLAPVPSLSGQQAKQKLIEQTKFSFQQAETEAEQQQQQPHSPQQQPQPPQQQPHQQQPPLPPLPPPQQQLDLPTKVASSPFPFSVPSPQPPPNYNPSWAFDLSHQYPLDTAPSPSPSPSSTCSSSSSSSSQPEGEEEGEWGKVFIDLSPPNSPSPSSPSPLSPSSPPFNASTAPSFSLTSPPSSPSNNNQKAVTTTPTHRKSPSPLPPSISPLPSSSSSSPTPSPTVPPKKPPRHPTISTSPSPHRYSSLPQPTTPVRPPVLSASSPTSPTSPSLAYVPEFSPSKTYAVSHQQLPKKREKSHLKVCFLGPTKSSGRRAFFLCCSVKQKIDQLWRHDPRLRSVRGVESVSGFGLIVYDLFDCPISSDRLEELVKKKEREREGIVKWKGGSPPSSRMRMERGEEDLELWEAGEALEKADLVCICFSLVEKGKEQAWMQFAPLVRQLIPGAAILFVGTEREKRSKILASSEVGSILLGGVGKGPRSREGVFTDREGWEMMKRMEEEEGGEEERYGYVEISSSSLEGVKGFVSTGLRLVFNKREKAPSVFRKSVTVEGPPVESECSIM